MTLEIIGAGFGRTGTYSLKTALESLGFGPCHHMSEVVHDAAQIANWSRAAAGFPDHARTLAGFRAAVDFPVAAFWRDVLAVSPDCRVILSYRDPDTWYESFSQTILPLILDRESWPANARPWFEMLEAVIVGKALGGRTDRDGIIAAYIQNEKAVRDLAQRGRALVFDSRDGWGPLCDFLGVDEPKAAYPVSNRRETFFASIDQATKAIDAPRSADKMSSLPNRRGVLQSAGALVAGASILAAEAPHAQTTTDGDAEMTAQATVRNASETFYAALNSMANGDPAPMAAAWVASDDAMAQHPIGGRDRGRDQVVASFAAVAEIADGGDIALWDQTVDVAGDMAVETGIERGWLSLAGHRAEIDMRVTNVYRLRDGHWKIQHHHADLSPAMLDVLEVLSQK